MEEVGSPDEGLDMRSRDSFEKLERLPLVGPGAPQRGGSSGEGPSLYSWHHATLIIVGEVLGTGIMGLPSAMVPLGWVCGLGSCVLFAGTAVYSGVLLSRVRSMYPGGALGYADVAHRLFGRRFGCFTNCAILFNWFFLLPYYLMAAANGLVIAFYDVDACYYQWAALVMGGLFPAMQIRTLHGLRHAALVSDAVVVLCIVIILATLSTSAVPAAAAEPSTLPLGGDHPAAAATASTEGLTTMWPPGPSSSSSGDGGALVSRLARFGSAASFVFAYQGQSMFLEIMKEMQRPQDFPRAVRAANGGMGLLYLLTVAVGYGRYGQSVAGFLPASMPNGIGKRLVGVGLCYHICVSFLLTFQPLGEKLAGMLWAADAQAAAAAARRHHCMLTLAVLAGSFLIANLIPFFSDFQNIIGSALGAPIVFGWPPLFYLRAMAAHGRAVPARERLLCRLSIGVALPLCFFVGLGSALAALMQSWEKYGRPFDCTLVGYAR